ncbi:MAG: hypothetical protein GY815_15855 [Gammaproteobacteria bacterium]|nr:hypothetical protein [Gammaproteobacteria bacterium]
MNSTLEQKTGIISNDDNLSSLLLENETVDRAFHDTPGQSGRLICRARYYVAIDLEQG